MDNFNKKKYLDDLKKIEDDAIAQKLLDEHNKKQSERDNDYKNKLNFMNGKIYDNGLKHNGYLQNNGPNSANRINEPFQLKNDFEFNKRLAELKALDRDNLKKDPSMLQERLRELDRQREIDGAMKNEKMDHQKLYKDFLDQQKHQKYLENQHDFDPNDGKPQLLMPSYNYPNKAMPTNKMAKDSIILVKNNLLFNNKSNNPEGKDMNQFFSWQAQYETLIDYGGRNYYLGDTKMRHNPITHPINDSDYNKYVLKIKNNLSHNVGNQDTTLVKAGNNIMA